MNFYPFHIGDYLSHTSHLSDAEDLAYRRMIDLYYQTEAPFTDVNQVARRIRSTPEIVSVILSDFFLKSENGWQNKRADEEIAKYHMKAQSARNANQAKINRKILKSEMESDLKSELKSAPDHDATKNHEPRTMNHEPILKPHRSKSEKNHSDSDQFSEFWDLYPKKVGKDAARKAWVKIQKPVQVLELIKNALAWQSVSQQWIKEGGQFIPNPATYLNQARWLDQPLDVEPAINAKSAATREAARRFLNQGEGVTYD